MMLRDKLLPWRRKAMVRTEDDPWISAMERFYEDFPSVFGKELWPFDVEFGGPKVDIAESDKAVTVTAEVPGIDPKGLEVTTTSTTLTLKGHKEESKEEKDARYTRRERAYGAFCRTIALPCEVLTDRVNASFKNGVLSVTLPKTEAAQKATRNVSVKVE